MAHHVLETPVSEEQVRRLRVGDTVTLEKTIFGIRDATLIAMFDRGASTRLDLAGHAVLHTAPNVKPVEPSAENPARYAPICVGTTTSMRMERFTRPLMEHEGVRLVVGKGGMGRETLAAFGDLGGAYLAVIGGAAALQTTWVEAIEDIDFEELNPECLWRFRIRGFGPLLVTMDSHGGSLHRDVHEAAAARRDEVLARIGALK
jgi:L(+)-tartrate dehydratase beta subunit